MSTETVNDVEISCNGIDMLINNDWDGCEALFAQHKDLSPLLNYCSSYMTFLVIYVLSLLSMKIIFLKLIRKIKRAAMTFEDALLDKAQKELEATEKLCSDPTKKFSIKRAFGFSSSSSSNKLNNLTDLNQTKEKIIEEKFTKAIILADCKLFLALLTFIRQEVSAYLTSGILQIRNAWKKYAKIQKQLYELYKKIEPNAEKIYGCDPNSNVIELLIEESDDVDNKSNGSNSVEEKLSEADQAINDLTIAEEEGALSIPVDVVKRLLGAVSFGYGIFQISLSFMPSNILKLIKIFGFEGDRNVALKALNFCSNSRDMRAPYADIVLLWYSTIAVPLFGVSEAETQISNEDTKLILRKNLLKYPKSSLFLYMEGKYNRTVLRDLSLSLASYQLAAKNSEHIREIQSISIYEMGWLYLMNLDYAKADEQFEILHKTSRWSRSFSTYICAILHGSMGDFLKANQYVKDAIKILAANTRKSNPIEVFASKRTEYFKKNPITSKPICELLIIELLYMWVCIIFCEEANQRKMLEICDQINDKNFVPLKCLIEGSINVALNNAEFGEQCFNECLARGETAKLPFAKFIFPCAYYELAVYNTNEKNYDKAKTFLSKAQAFKDYELNERVGTQIKSLQRRIKYYADEPKIAALLKSREEANEEQKFKRENEIKNFYVQ